MCSLFAMQVRAEERSAAKSALHQAIERTKQQLAEKYSQETMQGGSMADGTACLAKLDPLA